MSARSRKANKALYNKRKGSSARTSVRDRAPFLIRGVLSSRNRQVCRGEFFDAGNDLHPLYRKALDLFAGAMLYVVVEKLIPEMSQGQHSNVGTVFFCGGLQRDDGAGCGTGVTVGVPESEIFFGISENA